jgi:hypothetical protein
MGYDQAKMSYKLENLALGDGLTHPGIHIGSTWFVLETGCDVRLYLQTNKYNLFSFNTIDHNFLNAN